MSDLSGQASGTSALRNLIIEVLQLQTVWDWRNSPEMQRRGLLIRNEGPDILRQLLVGADTSAIPDLAVEGSDGAGRKSRIPWIRVFSRSGSPSPTSGWYLVYLFAPDGSCAYLSLNQGTRDPATGFGPRSDRVLRERVDWAREALAESGAFMDGAVPDIELNDPDLGASYQAGNVVALPYLARAIPDDRKLRSDLLLMAGSLATVSEADRDFEALPAGYRPGEALFRFSRPVQFVSENLGALTEEPGVHVVWSPEKELVYAGSTNELRTRMLTHLRGRESSILSSKVGRMLGGQLGREATAEDIKAFLHGCEVAWLPTVELDERKRRIMEELRPKFNDIFPQGWSESAQVLAVYVGQKAAQTNLQVGLDARTWGFPRPRDDYAKVRSGDWVVFGLGYTGGNVRTAAENWTQNALQRVIVGRVTRPLYMTVDPLWPDEKLGQASYPHRFQFEIVDNLRQVSLDADSSLGASVVEALRLSATNPGGVLASADGDIFRVEPEPVHDPEPPANETGPPPAEDREPLMVDLSTVCREFALALTAANLDFGKHHAEFVQAFVVSLATRRLVLLTGLSGSGKTRIALGFGQWLGPGRRSVIPVRPDWTGPEPLLGYEDALLPLSGGRRACNVPQALEFILRAIRDPEAPYLLVLDEMNLAHVERYFADLLSGMESAEEVIPNLRKEEDGLWRVPAGAKPLVPVPRNLFVVGTVNVDETTYMFSPKVLDRANTLEFRVASDDLRVDALPPVDVAPGGAALPSGFLAYASDERFQATHPPTNRDLLRDHLVSLHRLLTHYGFEFGHRIFYEALRFAALLEAAGETGQWRALDLQVKQKVLPRLHGSARRLQKPLTAVARFCADPSSAALEPGSVDEPFDIDAFDPQEAALPESFDKARRMMESLRANQFASFSE